MRILIDNGHGQETAGKRSPDGVLREYAYTREIAAELVSALRARGFKAEQIVPEETDVPLRERCERVNRICREEGKGNVLLVSLHCNAAKNSGWSSARGWSVHVSPNASAASKRLALRLIESAEEQGLKVRRYSPQQPYWVQNLSICRDTNCPAVLTENLFQDNKEDVALLLSEEGREKLISLHIRGILHFILNTQK